MPRIFSVAIGSYQDPTIVHFSDPDLLSQFVNAYAQSDDFDRLEVTVGTASETNDGRPWYGDHTWLSDFAADVIAEHVGAVAFWQINTPGDLGPDHVEFFEDDTKASEKYTQLLNQNAFPKLLRVVRLWRAGRDYPFMMQSNWVAS